jgi:hypothetical protein
MEQVVFLEDMTVGLATASGTLVRKQILPRNKSYRWPSQPDKTLSITDGVLDDIIKNFNARTIDTVPFFKVNDRNGHTEDPEAARGVVVGLEKTADGLDALIQPINDVAREQILSTKLGASAGLNLAYKKHDTGEDVGAVLRHVAWTPEPWISGMRSFEEASLSGETFETIYLSAEDEADEGGEHNMAELTQEQVQEMIASAVSTATTELSATLATQTQQIADLSTALNHREETATEESVTAELAAMVTAGLPPAIADLARPILMVGSTEVNLSADETGSIGTQVRSILKAFPKVDFRELGEGQIEGFVVLSAEDAAKMGYTESEDDGDKAELSEEQKAIDEIVATIPADRRISHA